MAVSPLHRAHLARAFAQTAVQALSHGKLASKLRDAPLQEEHKIMAPDIRKLLQRFLAEHEEKCADVEQLFDWEGNHERTWHQGHSYELLGTSALPDAAVLSPFTCAFEFDRGKEGKSHLKDCLMKTAAHVLSGAYESAVLVFRLPEGHRRKQYLEDDSPHSQFLIETLRGRGLYVCLVEE